MRILLLLVLCAACAACSKDPSRESPEPTPPTVNPRTSDNPEARRGLSASLEETFRRAGFAAKFDVRGQTLVMSGLRLQGDDMCRDGSMAALLAPAKPNLRIALEAPAIDAKALLLAGFTRAECENHNGRVYGEDLPLKADHIPPPMKEGAIPEQSYRDVAFSVDTTLGEAISHSSNDAATQAMVDLWLYCKQATKVASDPLDDVWHTVRTVHAKKTSVTEDGERKPVWAISVEFDDRRKNVHKGASLHYRLDEQRAHVFPADQLSGELCDLPAGKWSKLE